MAQKKIGILGYGALGKAYARSVERLSGADIVATAGPYCDGDRYLHFESSEGLLARGDLDAVILSGPTTMLADALSMAVHKGLGVMLCGPPGVSQAQAKRVRDIAMSVNPDAPIYVASPLFGHSSIIRALELAEQGVLGRILHIRAVFGHSHSATDQADWRDSIELSGGGVLLHEGFELVRLIEAFAGKISVSSGMADQLVDLAEKRPEDNAFGMLRSEMGAMAQFHVSATQWRHLFRMEVTGEQGYLWMDGLMPKESGFAPEMLVSAKLRRNPSGQIISNPAEEVRAFEDDGAMDRNMISFLSVLAGEPPPAYATMEAAQRALEVVHRIYASAGFVSET